MTKNTTYFGDSFSFLGSLLNAGPPVALEERYKEGRAVPERQVPQILQRQGPLEARPSETKTMKLSWTQSQIFFSSLQIAVNKEAIENEALDYYDHYLAIG